MYSFITLPDHTHTVISIIYCREFIQIYRNLNALESPAFLTSSILHDSYSLRHKKNVYLLMGPVLKHSNRIIWTIAVFRSIVINNLDPV